MGDRAVLVSTQGPEEREHVWAVLESRITTLGPGAELRRGMRDVLVEVLTPDAGLRERVADALALPVTEGAHESSPGREHVLGVRYEGTDLAAVSRLLGVTAAAVTVAHAAQTWRVAMLGFAPGFGYLEPVGRLTLDWSALERRESPRSRVPRGSVAVAAGMSAVYPQEMPGGWHLIGVSDVVLFDAENGTDPSLLAAGDLVRFVEAST